MLFLRTEVYISSAVQLGVGWDQDEYIIRSVLTSILVYQISSSLSCCKAELAPTWCAVSFAMENGVKIGFSQEKTDVLVWELQAAKNLPPRADNVPF